MEGGFSPANPPAEGEVVEEEKLHPNSAAYLRRELKKLQEEQEKLKEEKDKLLEERLKERERLKELEAKSDETASAAKFIVQRWLTTRPGVDYSKPAYYLKYAEAKGEDNTPIPKDGSMLVHIPESELLENDVIKERYTTSDNVKKAAVELMFENGRCVTNNLEAARYLVKQGKGISLSIVEV